MNNNALTIANNYQYAVLGTTFYILPPKQSKILSLMKQNKLEDIEFLEEEGFKFKTSKDSTLSGIDVKYIYAYDEYSTIWIQKIIDPYIGILYNWHNSDLNDKYAEIKNTYKNTEYEEEQQYNEYQKWLKYYNLTNKQIIAALDYYDKNN